MEDHAKLTAREHLITIVLAVAQRDCELERCNGDGGGAGASRWMAGPGGRRSCGRAAELGLRTRCARLQPHIFNVAVADIVASWRSSLCAAASVSYDPHHEIWASSRQPGREPTTLSEG